MTSHKSSEISGSFEPLDVLTPLERLGRGYKKLVMLAEFSSKRIPLIPFVENRNLFRKIIKFLIVLKSSTGYDTKSM